MARLALAGAAGVSAASAAVALHCPRPVQEVLSLLDQSEVASQLPFRPTPFLSRVGWYGATQAPAAHVKVPLYETVWCPKTGLPKPVHRSTVAATVLLRGDRWHVHSLIVEMGFIEKDGSDKAGLTDDLLAPIQGESTGCPLDLKRR